MQKVFWDDPYQTTLLTKIAAVEGDRVLLDATIAFSFSGGQESDKAMINDVPVLNSVIDGNLIYYILPENHGFSVGDEITMTIDWPRRHRLMRLHFAAELILELVTRKLDIENQRRYWEVQGFSKVPCGGTHVKSTAEVGAVTLKRVNVGGGKERIEIKLL